ncbi:GNAT family N-acetyltransferase [Pedobacter sp. PAMC26386]|nr:GNAT family N-acetyltransferase [Pedobacter sp. PAMC26386]
MVNTTRLVIKPLTFSQLKKFILLDGSLEEELMISYTPRVISPEFKEALEQTILPKINGIQTNYLYSTLWAVISTDLNQIVGDLCFIGAPNEDGEIEIGYGTYEAFRNQGYMKEAIYGMIQWAAKQPGVKYIIAHTLKSNRASFILLKKNNFIQVDEMEFLYKWQFKLKEP